MWEAERRAAIRHPPLFRWPRPAGLGQCAHAHSSRAPGRTARSPGHRESRRALLPRHRHARDRRRRAAPARRARPLPTGRGWTGSRPPTPTLRSSARSPPCRRNRHVEQQVSVHPDSARGGIGRVLLDRLPGHAPSEGAPSLTSPRSPRSRGTPPPTRAGPPAYGRQRDHPGLRKIREREAAHDLNQ